MKIVKKYLMFLIILLLSITTASCSTEINNGGNSNNNNNSNTNTNDKTKELLDIEYTMYEVFTEHNDFANTNYDYIYMGYYPQHEITDKTIVSALDKISTTNEFGYIEYLDHYFVKFTVVYNFYHAIEGQEGPEVFFTATGYEPGTVHYFLVEPIKWRVLYQIDNNLVLLAENVLDAKCFSTHTETRIINGKEIYPSNYVYSDIREWLNNNFYNQAFTDEERAMINLTENINECPNSYLLDYEQAGTSEDYVFLPSYQDTINRNYGFLSSPIAHESRVSQATNFASANGLVNHIYNGSYTNVWLIRNAYEFVREYASNVSEDGKVTDYFFPESPNTGIRPMMNITLSEK